MLSSEIHPRKREFIEHNFASASSRGHWISGYEVRIGSWNIGVPDDTSCMGNSRKKFEKWLDNNMKKLRLGDLDLICFQEVNRHWAEHIQMLLQRQPGGVRSLRSLLESLPSPPRRDGEGAAPCMDGLRRGACCGQSGRSLASPQGPSRNHEPKSSTLRSVSLLGRAQHRCPVWLTLFEDVDAGMNATPDKLSPPTTL